MFKFYDVETLIKESDFWMSLLVTFIGTLLGFIGAFYLTKWTERKQVKKQEQDKYNIYKDRLYYLNQLIKSSLKIIEDQLVNFEELANELIQYPTRQNLLKIIASNDLDRLQSMDTQEIFHAYYWIIPNYDNKIDNYKKIYSSIDFLYLRLKQAIESTDKNVNFTFKDQMYIKETTEHLSNVIYAWIKELEKNNGIKSQEYEFLVTSHKSYIKLIEEKAEICDFETEFLVPFGNKLRQSFSRAIFFSELNVISTKIILKYNHIKENSKLFSIELKDLRKEMNNSINVLKEINGIIENQLN